MLLATDPTKLSTPRKRVHTWCAAVRKVTRAVVGMDALVCSLSSFRMQGIGLVASVLLLVMLPVPQLFGGELAALREDVREKSSSNSSSSSDVHHSHDDCCDDSCLGTGWGDLLFLVLAAPYWGPPALVDDNYSERGFFPHYPYENGTPGFMVGEFDAPTAGYSAHLRTRLEYADNFDELSRIGGRVLFEHTSRFGIDSSFDLHRETLSPGVHDELSLGDVNVVFRFAQSDLLIMRSGLGMNWMNDDAGTELGFNFTYGGDLFPVKPWVISSELDWGTLGHTTLFHLRGTVGVQINRATIYTGYDFLDVGRGQTHGLIGGVELWF